MDTRTRHALKTNSFAHVTADSMNWLSGHRSGVLRWVVAAAVLIVAGAAALGYWSWSSSKADTALGAALDIYTAPLAQPGEPATPGTYATSADRAKAANQQFAAVAQKYGWLAAGIKAHYFTAVTDEELGQNAQAEAELKIAAGAWDRSLANLAKLALAGLYRQTKRDSDAIEVYKALAVKPSDTVSTAVAQLDLADLYSAEGNQAQAKALWAQVKDADKDGAAGSIAAQKLGAKQ